MWRHDEWLLEGLHSIVAMRCGLVAQDVVNAKKKMNSMSHARLAFVLILVDATG